MQTHISGTYLGCGRVWSGADGCEWVYMGVLGYRGMGTHKKKTNITTNGLVGQQLVWFRCMYGREIIWKICTCTVNHKEGNEGLRSVGMSSGGCRGMHGHATNAKQDKKSN